VALAHMAIRNHLMTVESSLIGRSLGGPQSRPGHIK